MRKISFVVPVYNRPEELRELLESLVAQTAPVFEVLVIEDGSAVTCFSVVEDFQKQLPLVYFYKENTGPGDSRNYGMSKATGDFFIILDSDCVLPKHYLKAINEFLSSHEVGFFGGSDAAHPSFSPLQKAINFVMTSMLTTGGLRGHTKSLQKFEPRSFNMGISRSAFEQSGGFGLIHPGEDPDLSIRLWQLGFESSFVAAAYVFHKRRISWSQFHKQVHAFGSVRPILMKRYPAYAKKSFWLPSLFVAGVLSVILTSLVGWFLPLIVLFNYLLLLFLVALYRESPLVAFLVIPALFIQMFGYGIGFLNTSIKLTLSKKPAEELFPHLFFKKTNGAI